MGEVHKMKPMMSEAYKNERLFFFKGRNLNSMMKKEGAGKQQYVIIPTISLDLYSKDFNPGHLYYNSISVLWLGFCFMFYFARPESKVKEQIAVTTDALPKKATIRKFKREQW